MGKELPIAAATSIEEQLRNVLAFVDGHVKFAETKNVALLAFNGAIIVGVIQAWSASPTALPWFARTYAIYLLCISVLAGTTALVSFLPKTDVPFLRTRRDHVADSDNLLFFGHAQNYRGRDYFSSFLRAIGQPDRDPTALELMYAEQIIINSQIASGKFAYFEIGGWLSLFGILTFVVAGPIFVRLKDRQRNLDTITLPTFPKMKRP